jgi:tetratricopeptide (TPR) repeat protein/DNA-binding XRE family transcriptional regulator
VKDPDRSLRNPHLRAARLSQGWSQQKLAGLIGTTFVNVSRWENGMHAPSLYYRHQLMSIFGKTPAELGLPPLCEPKVWNIPYARNLLFTGREHLLATLHSHLLAARKASSVKPLALYGLGGIGKTAIAVEYAFRYRDDYICAFWIRAATHDTFVNDFVRLAQLLALPEKESTEQRITITAIQRWLATHEDWLLILDSAEDLRMAQEFLPSSHKGALLFTTRTQAVGTLADGLEVEKLAEPESALLLLRRSKLPLAQAEDLAAAERIVRELDGLPLAIVQAGAYIEETRCSLADYLHLYVTHRKDLLGEHSQLQVDYDRTVTTTWSLAFQQVEQQNPIAADFLRFCAFLAPDAISEELLARGGDELGTVLGAAVRDPFRLNEALRVLLRYSLVRRDASAHILTVHRLVQQVLRESMDQQTQQMWAERAVRAIHAAFPDDRYHAGPQHWISIPHIQECATLIERYHLHFPQAAHLLYLGGDFLYFHALYVPSEALHQQALAIRQHIYGAEHPAVAESLNALAILARLQGNYKRAEQLHLQALTLRERVLGPEHALTAMSCNNLGVLSCTQGRYAQAEHYLQRALGIREQVLGSRHADTLLTSLNLAKLQIEQRRYEQAEHLLTQTLATGEQALEPAHPVIAHNLGLLGRVYAGLGEYEQAERFYQRSLAICQQTHGPEHPAVAERLDDLADLAFARGHDARAQTLGRQAVEMCERTLGDQHPDTIAYREHLVRMRNPEIEQDT